MRADLLVLGMLASAPDGDRAREALLRALVVPATIDDAVDAAALALDAMRSRLADDEALSFARSVTEVAASGPKELRAKLRSTTSWPTRRAQEPVDADEEDRALERSGL